MVHLTESQSWQWAFQALREASRWDLPDADVERHMAVAFEYVMETLGQVGSTPGRRIRLTSSSASAQIRYSGRAGESFSPRDYVAYSSASGHCSSPAAVLNS